MSEAIPTISVVIPVYNECTNIPTLLSVVLSELHRIKDSHEIIVIDDGSSDNTWLALSQFVDGLELNESVHLHCVQLSRNFGKESALSAGLEISNGRAVIVMDGDLQHPPELISEMIRLWRHSHVDVVEAIKSHRGNEGLIKRVGSNLFYSLFKILCGYDFKGSSDYKLLDRKVVDALLEMGERNLFFRGMVEWLGFQRHQLTFEVPERSSGVSGWSTFRLIKMAVEAITAYSFVPLRLVAAMGFFCLIVSLLFSGYALIYKFLGLAVSGFTTVIILQLFIGSICMLSIGVIGEYIARIYEETKRRPRYVVMKQITCKRKENVEDVSEE